MKWRRGVNLDGFYKLVDLYDKCGFVLNMCSGCTGELVTTPAALDEFLAGFYLQYPDPATQLGGDCENVFTAAFNSAFNVAFTFTQIEDYYWVQRQIHINVCQSQCSRMVAFIASFNTRFAGLKLPTGAREDLFTFEYNKAFIQGGGGKDGGLLGTGGNMTGIGASATDPNAFNPTVNFAQLQNLINECGITGFSLAPVGSISIYDPQVLLSLKQVYYAIHPNGMVAD